MKSTQALENKRQSKEKKRGEEEGWWTNPPLLGRQGEEKQIEPEGRGEGASSDWSFFQHGGLKVKKNSPLCPCPGSATVASSIAFPPALSVLVWLLLTWTAAPRWQALCVCVLFTLVNTQARDGTVSCSHQCQDKGVTSGAGEIYYSAIWQSHRHTNMFCCLGGHCTW